MSNKLTPPKFIKDFIETATSENYTIFVENLALDAVPMPCVRTQEKISDLINSVALEMVLRFPPIVATATESDSQAYIRWVKACLAAYKADRQARGN